MNNYVAFIQIVDTSKLKKNSAKPKQWKALERSIQGHIALEEQQNHIVHAHHKRWTGRTCPPPKTDSLTLHVPDARASEKEKLGRCALGVTRVLFSLLSTLFLLCLCAFRQFSNTIQVIRRKSYLKVFKMHHFQTLSRKRPKHDCS